MEMENIELIDPAANLIHGSPRLLHVKGSWRTTPITCLEGSGSLQT